MINRFIAELNTESKMPSNSYNNDYVAALDLSRHRDSVETRKTPSPYNTNSSRESASPQTGLDHASVQISSNSPNSSGYAASTYTSSTFMLDRPVPLHKQPYMYGYPPGSPSEHSYFLPHPNLSLRESNVPEDHIKEDPPYNPSSLKSSGLHQQQPHMRVSTPIITPPTECQRRTPEATADQKSIKPSVAAVVNTLPPMLYPKLISRDRKIARPFKAYPRDPLAMAATFTATDALLDAQKAEKYSAFRKRMLEQIHASNGGRATISNPKMRRNCSANQVFLEEQANDSSSGNEDHSSSGADSCNNPGDNKSCSNNNNSSAINQNGIVKDAAYYERRKKNNAAAKKSRDRRRIKEDEIAVRAAFLEHENIELRIELAALKNQLAMLTANASR